MILLVRILRQLLNLGDTEIYVMFDRGSLLQLGNS